MMNAESDIKPFALSYLSGPTGLLAYSIHGELDHIYRVGLDLPPAPLGKLAVGTLADSHAPELLIATSGEGVLAFDGERFRQISSVDKSMSTVTDILPLASGRLLIGTQKRGLLVYDGKTLRSFHATTEGVYVTALAGNEAELWIGALGHGVLHWHGGRVEAVAEAQGLPDMHVESIAMTPEAVYVGTPVGVAEIRDGKPARVLARGCYARALLAEADSLYVGQIEGSVLRVDSQALTPESRLRRAITAPWGAGFARQSMRRAALCSPGISAPLRPCIRAAAADAPARCAKWAWTPGANTPITPSSAAGAMSIPRTGRALLPATAKYPSRRMKPPVSSTFANGGGEHCPGIDLRFPTVRAENASMGTTSAMELAFANGARSDWQQKAKTSAQSSPIIIPTRHSAK